VTYSKADGAGITPAPRGAKEAQRMLNVRATLENV
jgi:hypothetical protein